MINEFLDDLLDPDEDNPSESEPETISPSNALYGEDKDYIDKNGNIVATIEAGSLDPMTLDTKYRLVIPVEYWAVTDVICDGNAVEVTTEKLSDSRYKVKKAVRGYSPMVVEQEETLEPKYFDSVREFYDWMEKLSPDLIDAYHQIYYDRWCFDTANKKDQIYYQLLEDAKNSRE